MLFEPFRYQASRRAVRDSIRSKQGFTLIIDDLFRVNILARHDAIGVYTVRYRIYRGKGKGRGGIGWALPGGCHGINGLLFFQPSSLGFL